MEHLKGSRVKLLIVAIPLLLSLCLVNSYEADAVTAVATPLPTDRRVNVPDVSDTPFEPAIFWFGGVDSTKNNADVRMWYHDTHLELTVHIIDRRLWQDATPTSATLTEWDSVSLFFNVSGNQGNTPGLDSYRLVTQLGANNTSGAYKAAFRGNGATWTEIPVAYNIETSWRGDGGPNTDIDNKGWQLTVAIPFSSLGVSSPPAPGTIWGLGVRLNDRDTAASTPIPDQIWPEQMNPTNPSTWGQLHFGRANWNPPSAAPQGITTIQHGFNGAVVPDAHVGGNFTCGENLVDYWSGWGNANYASESANKTQINIQNQWDISDYPCFSKYYITFPINTIPPGKTIISARLTMTLFGNSGGGQWGEPPDSFIHALSVGEAWNETTLTWNNAPLALENISGTWVKPVQTSDQREYDWDVSKAVAQALANQTPLRLALYSIDGERHTGKYFWSSDSNDWGGTIRPKLEVVWGEICGSPDVECFQVYLPVAQK